MKVLFRRQAEDSCLRGLGHLLFRQADLAFNTEVPGGPRRSGIRLAAAEADGVIAACDDRTAVLRHHAQVSTLQLKMNLLACARVEVNALESPESYLRRPVNRREFQIELHDFVPCQLSGIGHCHISSNRIARIHGCLWQGEIAVTEGRVTQAIAERIKWLSVEVAVGARLHGVVLKMGQLMDAPVEGNRQTARRIILPA